ncbi:hypothetical protein [Ferrimonas balearica]|uniref:hypothetical protein n=1 Tax=Ferrimonas balearica TaxID=44012 RepID=UPI001C99967E|nr:hypothetical protein [Ferrimonas balearica]MBY5990914.1 hypothetical protein [Ferrimonas balearica]
MDLKRLGGITLLGSALMGCGWSPISSDSDIIQPPVELPTFTQVNGGPANSPSPVVEEAEHVIDIDGQYNHFVFDAEAGDRVLITALLANEIDPQGYQRCGQGADDAYPGIAVEGLGRACGTVLFREVAQAGAYPFQVAYPDANYGGFNIRVYRQVEPVAFDGQGGPPDAPRHLDPEDDAWLSVTLMHNWFVYDGQAGQTLHLQAYLNALPDEALLARCAEADRAIEAKDSFGFLVGDGPVNCSDRFEYHFERDQRLYLGFKPLRAQSAVLDAYVE